MGKKFNSLEKTVLQKTQEIENLKKEINELKIESEKKDKLLSSIESLRLDLQNIVNTLKCKQNEYDALIDELKQMRKIINDIVFKGKWKLVKFLLR